MINHVNTSQELTTNVEISELFLGTYASSTYMPATSGSISNFSGTDSVVSLYDWVIESHEEQLTSGLRQTYIFAWRVVDISGSKAKLAFIGSIGVAPNTLPEANSSAYMYVGSNTTSAANATTTTTNNYAYIKLFNDSTLSRAIKIVGSGDTRVRVSNSGTIPVITIQSPTVPTIPQSASWLDKGRVNSDIILTNDDLNTYIISEISTNSNIIVTRVCNNGLVINLNNIVDSISSATNAKLSIIPDYKQYVYQHYDIYLIFTDYYGEIYNHAVSGSIRFIGRYTSVGIEELSAVHIELLIYSLDKKGTEPHFIANIFTNVYGTTPSNANGTGHQYLII